MKAVVLAGGLGTRLRNLVPDLPKPMAPVAGRPFLEYILDRLIAGGVHEIILSVGYRAEAVKSHFGCDYRRAAISYAHEMEPLGTGGAIVHALHVKGNAPVLVLNGDTFLNIDYRELARWYEQSPAKIALVLKHMPDVSRYGAVLVSGEKVAGFVEKGQTGSGLINAGVYILQPDIFEPFELSRRFSFEVDFLQQYWNILLPRAFLTNAYLIDIGVPDDYGRAQRELPRTLRIGHENEK